MTEDWRRVTDVNPPGAIYLSQGALRHMLARGAGRIVHEHAEDEAGLAASRQ